jgi:Kef-type K+ transport system membrane component KefB
VINVENVMPRMVLTLGLLTFFAIVIKKMLHRSVVPALPIYLLLGIALASIDGHFHLVGEEGMRILEFLGLLGVFALLFKTGIESDLAGLLKKMKSGKYIWLVNIMASAGIGFATAFWLLQQPLATSLFVAVGLSATSIGVSIASWKEQEALEDESAKTILAVAEMDDISGVLMMVALFAVAPDLKGNVGMDVLFTAGWTLLGKLIVFALFVGLCLLFSRYVEPRLTRMCENLSEKEIDPMLLITAMGMCIAAIADIIGFSIAIGAFLVGLSFSRDPEAVKAEKSFLAIYDFLVPFFFISIGAKVEPSALLPGLGIGALLVLAVVIGKFLGSFIPSLAYYPAAISTLIGLSMIPHAEITMVVASKGLSLGNEVMSNQIFSALVVVVAVTSVATPIILSPLIGKWINNTRND